jgi:hypothetical protein
MPGAVSVKIFEPVFEDFGFDQHNAKVR